MCCFESHLSMLTQTSTLHQCRCMALRARPIPRPRTAWTPLSWPGNSTRGLTSLRVRVSGHAPAHKDLWRSTLYLLAAATLIEICIHSVLAKVRDITPAQSARTPHVSLACSATAQRLFSSVWPTAPRSSVCATLRALHATCPASSAALCYRYPL